MVVVNTKATPSACGGRRSLGLSTNGTLPLLFQEHPIIVIFSNAEFGDVLLEITMLISSGISFLSTDCLACFALFALIAATIWSAFIFVVS